MTDTLSRRGGQPVTVDAMVTADQSTIIGNGTSADPLRAGSSTSTSFEAAFQGDSPIPGMPVAISSVNDPGGITTVQQSSGVFQESSIEAIRVASVIGVIKRVISSSIVEVQTSGILELTEEEWNLATDGSGGLSMGLPYYPSPLAGGAVITGSPPTVPGQWIARAGTAISSTGILIQPSIAAQIFGDLIRFCIWVTPMGANKIVGTPVYVTNASDGVSPADSSTSAATAHVIGVVAALDTNENPIVQTAGVVSLSGEEWSEITTTGTPLNPGFAYYLADSANPGKITTTPPVTGARLVISAPLREQL